jgi:hypothetical protein
MNEPDHKSPLTPLFQRGEILPFAKGGKEGFYVECLCNGGVTYNLTAMEISIVWV